MVDIKEPVWKSTYCVIVWNHNNHDRYFEVSLHHGNRYSYITSLLSSIQVSKIK